MTNFTNFSERIKQLIDFKGISINKFSTKLGTSNSYWNKVIKDNTIVGVDKVENILRTFPDVNSEWLLTGKGEMLKSNNHVVNEPQSSYGMSYNNLVPLLPIEAVAGFGVGDWTIHETDVQEKYLVPDFNGIDFMIKVKGSSMYPKYNSGDIVACRKINWQSFIQWNKPHVISTKEQGIIVKRINKSSEQNFFTLVSDNQAYPPFDIPQEEITGIALIIGVIRLE